MDSLTRVQQLAEVIPFRGIRYSQQLSPDLARLITPPYDVISGVQQNEYYDRSPYNIIRLELGKVLPEDDFVENRYSRAARYFSSWINEGILRQDPDPVFYLYQQIFRLEGEVRRRTAIMARVRLEPYENGSIIPHEETLPKAKSDRLALMRACFANFSPVFGLYLDEFNHVLNMLKDTISSIPISRVVDDEDTEHLLWLVDNPKICEEISWFFKERKIFIADGHHRYETALAFQKELAHRGHGPHDYVMMALVSAYDPGLVVLPTHRLVRNVPSELVQEIPRRLSAFYLLREMEAAEAIETLRVQKDPEHQLVAYLGGGRAFYARLKRDVDVEEMLDQSKSPHWRHLDVAILHKLVMEGILGIGYKETRGGEYLTYERDEYSALQGVDSGEQQAAFILRATPVDQVIAVSAAGDKMPQKSTFFYPKLVTGLVLNPLY